MDVTKDKLLSAIDEAVVLQHFKRFCDDNSSSKDKQRLRNIMFRSPNIENTVRNLFEISNIRLSEEECERMCQLLIAFLRKSFYRAPIDDSTKKKLLLKQSNKCNICGESINIHAHADHIVPFKYVGDELENNLQMLCSHCNSMKNASIDYEIRYLIKNI